MTPAGFNLGDELIAAEFGPLNHCGHSAMAGCKRTSSGSASTASSRGRPAQDVYGQRRLLAGAPRSGSDGPHRAAGNCSSWACGILSQHSRGTCCAFRHPETTARFRWRRNLVRGRGQELAERTILVGSCLVLLLTITPRPEPTFPSARAGNRTTCSLAGVRASAAGDILGSDSATLVRDRRGVG
jgi:hypothetical protein